ncbi:hypothetical protein [Empedobacter brevis]|uniref:hypothetical protein n=1 Tax=Empedobacter brevis TaxID=247 RepID=UPI0033427DC9
MDFEKELLKFIHQTNKEKSPLESSLSDLAVKFNSEIDSALRKFKALKYCVTMFEEGTGKVIILPLQRDGLKKLDLI